MASLVAYESSDDGQDDVVQRPVKLAKIDSNTAKRDNEHAQSSTTSTILHPSNGSAPEKQTKASENGTAAQQESPAPGPSMTEPDVGVSLPNDPDVAPISPYSFERQRLRELTMPTVPNFDIPDSPPPHPTNSEKAATLAATTKKFERFLELKKQGVHFNEKMQNSTSLRNPSLLPKLMEFAGISQADSYKSSLPEGAGVTVDWPEECYIESLMRQNERKEKKKMAERDKVDFVPAAKSANGKPREGKFDKT